jgi:hypothetical protein
MSKSFSVKLSREPSQVVAEFKTAAAQNNFNFAGDESQGRFSGKGIEGHYDINGDALTVTIEKKPLMATWALVESKLKGFFA